MGDTDLDMSAMAFCRGQQQQRMLALLVVVIVATGTANSMDVVGKARESISDAFVVPEQSTCLLQGSSSRQRLQPKATQGISEASRTMFENPEGTHDKKEEEKDKKSKEKPSGLELDPMAIMRVELHLKPDLKAIHKSQQGGLSSFLEVLRSEISKAARVPLEQISVLGARGAYVKLSTNSLIDVSMLEAEHGESIIDFEVLPGKFYTDRSPKSVFKQLQDTVHDKSSKIMKGPLKDLLAGSYLVLGNTLRSPVAVRDGAQRRWSCDFHILSVLALAAPWTFA